MSSIGETATSERMASRASLLFQQKREFFEAAHQPPPPIFLPIPDTPPGHSSERMSRFDFSMDTNPRRGSSVPSSSRSLPPIPPPKPKRTFAFDVWLSERLAEETKTGRLAKMGWDQATTLEERIIFGYWDAKKMMHVQYPPEETTADEGTQNSTDAPGTSSHTSQTSQMISRFERLSTDSQNGAAPPKKFERRLTRPDALNGLEEKIVKLKPVNGNNCTILEPGAITPRSPCESPMALKSASSSSGNRFNYGLTRAPAFRHSYKGSKGSKGSKSKPKKQRAKKKEGEAKAKRKERAELIRKETLDKIRKRNEEEKARTKRMLFDTALIVSVTRSQNDDGTYNHSPNVTYCFGEFPSSEKESKCIENICHLVYPDIEHATQLKRGMHRGDSCDHSFFVALTDENGVRTYAYCIKFEPMSSDTEPFYFPCVFALLTRTRDPTFFFELARKALVHIGDRIRLNSFLSTVRVQEHPRKGGKLIVMQKDEKGTYGKRSEIRCSFGCDKKMKSGWSVNDFVRQLHPEWIVAIIAACIAQQRIIITGSNVHAVTRAVNAIDALLRPLEWPFSFIPCIPDVLVEICATPTPYIFGLLRNNLCKITDLVMEHLGNDEAKNQIDFAMFDIDRGLVNPMPLTIKNQKHFQEEIGRFRHLNEGEREVYLRRKNCFYYCKSVGMPSKVAKNLINLFYTALEKEKSEHDIESCTEAMLIWYASLFGHIKSSGAFTDWNRAAKLRLVAKQHNPANREFLEFFVESSLFELWVLRRMKSDGRLILPAEELEMIDAIFVKFCEEYDYRRKKPVKAAFRQLFGSSRRT